MAVSCLPNDLAESAKCFCYPNDMQGAVMIYLLMQLAELDLTPDALAELAKPYLGMSQDSKDAAMVYLTCAAATAAGA